MVVVASLTSILLKTYISPIVLFGVVTGVGTLSFILFGINNYWFDNIARGIFAYVFTFAFVFWSILKLPSVIQYIIAVLGCLLFASFSFFVIKNTLAERKKFNAIFDKEEEYFDQKDAYDFKSWRDRYYNHEEPDSDSYFKVEDDDPLKTKARELFEGYMTDKRTFKKRYRELAMQYHPDRPTGDEELFKRIVTYYEDMQGAVND